MARLFLASILKALVERTIKKHKPLVIVVIGTGQTSLAREVIYSVIKQGFPARRNIETPEAEFSIPLTIFGYPKYPTSSLEWLWLLLKVSIQLVVIKPYYHVLVLEVNSIHKKTLDFWIQSINADYIVVAGDIPDGYAPLKNSKVFYEDKKAAQSGDILTPFVKISKELAQELNLSEDLVAQAVDTLALPRSKIRFLSGLNASLIIDATHYYFPQPLEAVLEIVDATKGRKVIFTDLPQDMLLLKDNKEWEINPSNYVPASLDTVILRGHRLKQFYRYESLIT